MMGSGDDHGIIPKMNDALFLEVNKLATDDLKFLLTVSYLEIYNEVVKDLLNPSDQQLKIREHPKVAIVCVLAWSRLLMPRRLSLDGNLC